MSLYPAKPINAMERPRRCLIGIFVLTALFLSFAGVNADNSNQPTINGAISNISKSRPDGVNADVTAVKGSAYGYFCSATVFSFLCAPSGPTPTVMLAADASNSPQAASSASATATAGPATIFTSDQLNVSTQGTLGPSGSVTSSANIANVGKSGNETFTASNVASTCSASDTGVTGSTTITGGMLQTDNGDDDPTNSIPDHPPANVAIPSSPAPNTTYEGHVHSGNTTDNFRYVFNEQIVNPDGSLTVNAAHLYYLGPNVTGELIIGQSVCGVTTATPSATPTPTPTPTATPSATPAATATPTPTPSATPGATASPTPTATPSATPTPTPTATPAQSLNISTRLRVETGDKVLIGGFIVQGTAPKSVLLRGMGPSLGAFGITGLLLDPILELRGPEGLIMTNDNWMENPQRAQFEGTPFQPPDNRESVVLATVPPENYTVILSGVGGTTGVGLMEIYDRNQAGASELGNFSTRGFVQTGNNVMIGGFILGGESGNADVAVRGIGPSLVNFGVTDFLADPVLELRDQDGALLAANDDWASDPVSAAQLTAHGLAPSHPDESGLFTSLPPGQFTAIVAGKNGSIGIALVEIYNLR